MLHFSHHRKLITSPFTVTLNIERTKGQTLDTSVQYYTEEPTEPVTVGQLTFEPAQAGSHFTLVAQDTVFFEPNKVTNSYPVLLYEIYYYVFPLLGQRIYSHLNNIN